VNEGTVPFNYATFNWPADVFELKRMLSSIGVKINAGLPAQQSQN